MSKFLKHFLSSNLERVHLYKNINLFFNDFSLINKISISYVFENSNLKMLSGSFLFLKLIFNKIFLFNFNIKNFKVSIALKKGSPSIFYYFLRKKDNYIFIESFILDLKKFFIKNKTTFLKTDSFSINLMVKDLEFLKKNFFYFNSLSNFKITFFFFKGSYKKKILFYKLMGS